MSYSNRKSYGRNCAVYGCTNNQRKRNILGIIVCPQHSVSREECRCDMFALHRFLTSPALRQQWIAAVNRKNFDATEASRLCSRHFVEGKMEENAVPMLDMGYEKIVVFGRRRLVRRTHRNRRRCGDRLVPRRGCAAMLDR
ncbi:uncharacterized protein LOC144128103 isoform X2 [Amblyomma americanum]